MKLAAIFALSALLAFGAGTCTVSGPVPVGQISTTTTWTATLTCTGDSATGSFPATTIPALQSSAAVLQGKYLNSVVVDPGSPAPTSGASITITDSLAADILGGHGAAALSDTVTKTIYPLAAVPLNGMWTVNLTGNSVNSAVYVIQLNFTTDTPVLPAIGTSSDVIDFWTGTCDATTFLRGDGACATASVITTGSGAPAAGSCDAAAEVGSLYMNTANTSWLGSLYQCVQSGASTYGWQLVAPLAGTYTTVAGAATGWTTDVNLSALSAASETMTNKTLDVEGTGNAITTVQKIWLQAVNCTGTTASLNWDTIATLAPAATCSAGTTNTGLIRGLAAFIKTEIDQIQAHIALPSDWTGAMDLKFIWQTAATTGSVVWQAATVCVADAEVNDAAWNAASTVTDAAKGTTLQTNQATITGITTTGCAAGELLHLKVFRDPDHASDDLDDTASLIGVEVTTRRAQ